ncbi:MAG: imidazolonepropionase-like amidohydrolase [Roseivirga sp.]|jgi:imidazolonepropionase-like amidohydrolase
MTRYLKLLIVTVLVITSCTKAQEADFAFTHVNVITMENDQVLKDQTVLIKAGKITKIGDAQSINISATKEVVDANGKYLTPGLAEMHAHIPGNQNGTELAEETLFLYLSNGITLIRGMLGQPYHIALRDQVERGEVLGPKIYTSGPSFNNNTVTSAEQGAQRVREQQDAGYDFLKLHPGLTRENFDAIVATANEIGITYAGHVSTGVGIRRAIEAKYSSIDHIDGYLEGLVPPSLDLDPDSNGFFGINFTEEADLSNIPELVQKTKEAGVWIVPTQAMMERWMGPTDPTELAKDPEMKYINPNTLNNWVSTKENVLDQPEYNAEQALEFNEIRREILKQLYEAGVGILLGSDAPQVFNVPGFSIQREMQTMVRSGMSAYEILKTGTVNPAIYFGDEAQYGMIKEGLDASLILLENNPLEDIGNMSHPAGVMVKGQWISREVIDARLNKIANQYGH